MGCAATNNWRGKMKRKLRVALMVLLAAVTSVGSAWGDWKEYTGVNGVTWEYKEIESGATCSIRPENRSCLLYTSPSPRD